MVRKLIFLRKFLKLPWELYTYKVVGEMDSRATLAVKASRTQLISGYILVLLTATS